MIFESNQWINIKQVWRFIRTAIKEWKVPFKDEEILEINRFEALALSKLKNSQPLPWVAGTRLKMKQEKVSSVVTFVVSFEFPF
jgi:hypothetical protein